MPTIRLSLTKHAFVRLVVYNTDDDNGQTHEARQHAATEMWNAVETLCRYRDRRRLHTNDDHEQEIQFYLNL